MTETKALSAKDARRALALESHANAKVDPAAAQAEAAKEPAPEPEPGAQPDEPEQERYTAEQIVDAYRGLVGAMGAAIARRRGLEGDAARQVSSVDGIEVAAVAMLAPQALPVLAGAKLPPVAAAGALAVVLAVSLAWRTREADRMANAKPGAKDAEPAPAASAPAGSSAGGMAGKFTPPGWARSK